MAKLDICSSDHRHSSCWNPSRFNQSRKTGLLLLALIFILSSCATQSHWSLNQIGCAHINHPLTKLICKNPEENNPLYLELFPSEEKIEILLNLQRLSFSKRGQIDLELITDGKQVLGSAQVYLGQMRAKLDPSTAQTLEKALLKNNQVTIRIDGFEHVIDPNSFSPLYQRLKQFEKKKGI